MVCESMDLRHHTDQDLLSVVTELVGSQRELTAKLVASLAEIEERRLHLTMGFASMFEFCVKRLRMGEGEAFRRILAARLSRRFPVLLSLLGSGAVHLSTLQLVGERLTEENHVELLEAVSGKTKREVQELLAIRFPVPDVPSKVRKLPKRRARIAPAAPGGDLLLETESAPTSGTPQQAPIAPLSEDRFKVEFTAGATLREKLERARNLMSHANPSRDLAVVFEHALDLLLAELERKKLGKARRPRRTTNERKTKLGRITNAVRREVFERDGCQCTFVSAEGQRCEARAFLELDHINPRARGGTNHPSNLRVRCRAHNLLWAEQVYGREQIKRARHLRQKKSTRERAGRQPAVAELPQQETSSGVLFERVRNALTKMGFRDAQARCAVAEVAGRHGQTPDTLTTEEILREALQVVDCGAAFSSRGRT
jgi:5-methylcytosine-specific restriction endonuclease McrA